MALPQNPNGITAGDRELLEASVAQSKNLTAQTKVLHKLSDNIKDQKKEYSKLREDIKELRKGFYTGDNKGFAEIKKYFEKSRDTSRFVSRSKLGTEDKDKEQKGFFKNAMNKLFGPSKYQQKMMDDTSAIAKFTEMSQMDIEFIKKQYEEPERAKERELLSQAIADKINKNNEGGGGGGGGGILGALGTAVGFLVKELADIFKSVVGNIVQGISGIFREIIKSVTDVLKDLLEWTKLGTRTAQSCCTGQPRIDLPEADRRDRTNPNSGQQRIPGGQQGQLPGQSQPQIGNEQKQIGYDKPEKSINERMKERMDRSGGISDAESKQPGGQGKPASSMSTNQKIGVGVGAIGATIAAVLAANEQPGVEDQYGAIKFLDEKINAAVGKSKETIKSVSGKIPPRYKDYGMGTGVDPDAAMAAVEKNYIAEGFAERLKATFEKVTDYVDEEIGHKFAAATKDFLNTVGELDINGEKINLFPNLGTATATVLNSVAEQTKDLVMGGIDMAGTATNYISNQVNNVSSGGASAPIILPSAPSVNTRPEIQQMLMGGVVIGGRRYH